MGKYAFLVNAKPDEPGPTANNLQYACALDEAGHDVSVYFDGQATQWIPELEDDTENVVHEYYHDAKDRGLIQGACGYCSGFFEVDDRIQDAGIDLEGEFVEDDSGPGAHHGPDVANLVDDGYELINVG